MATPSCIPLVQELLALQQSLRALLTAGVQNREPAGSLVASGGGCSKLENPEKAASTIRGMECQGVVKSWPWELPGPVTHFWGHSMQGGLGSSDPHVDRTLALQAPALWPPLMFSVWPTMPD